MNVEDFRLQGLSGRVAESIRSRVTSKRARDGFRIAAAAAGLLIAANGAAAGQDGWTPLFNGKDLSGWSVQCQPPDQGKTFWQVQDGAILCDSMGKRDHDYVWLVSDREFGDFELKLKFQAFRDSSGNSGVQFHSRYDPEAEGGGCLDGPQVDIHSPADSSWRTGLIYDETRGERRWVSPSLKGAKIDARFKTKGHVFKYADDGDGWNDLDVRCEGNQVKVMLNGVVITDWDGTGVLDNAAHVKAGVDRTGHFALQLHTHAQLRIRFRDILVREPTSSEASEPVTTLDSAQID